MYIKKFETGEWSRDVDWDFVKNNPDDDSEEANWIKNMQSKLEEIDSEHFEILDIRGFDLYSGPYAIVNILGAKFYVWENDGDSFFIKHFPISNTDEGENDGFKGYPYEIESMINDIAEAGSLDIYLNSKKYNL